MLCIRTGHRRHYARAQFIMTTKGYKHTLTIYNSYSFFTTTTVTRTRPKVTSHVQYMTCLVSITVQRDATQSSLLFCKFTQPHPSSGVHKTVTTASGTGHICCAATSLQRCQASLATLEGNSCSTGGCSHSFVYCWWWVLLTTETCRVNL